LIGQPRASAPAHVLARNTTIRPLPAGGGPMVSATAGAAPSPTTNAIAIIE
jgi:hypothetical protein